jgi:NAD(P)-dependent dehydrogenase (short-subunit alcohol dehydrogenase family)
VSTARFDLTDRVALVTGASRGLGRSIAVALAEAGAHLALGLRDAGRECNLVDEIKSLGRRAVALQMDVTDGDQIELATAEAIERLGAIDILVNNAGGGAGNTPVEDLPTSTFDNLLNVNLRGTLLTCQAAFPHMRERGFGRIVNVSSQAALVALPGEAAYCAAKAAVSHLTRCLALEWGIHGINVNALAPTFINTPGTAAALSDDRFRADVEDRIAALHRVGEPDDVAGAAVFLCSPAAAMVTGATLVIDGGWTIR